VSWHLNSLHGLLYKSIPLATPTLQPLEFLRRILNITWKPTRIFVKIDTYKIMPHKESHLNNLLHKTLRSEIPTLQPLRFLKQTFNITWTPVRSSSKSFSIILILLATIGVERVDFFEYFHRFVKSHIH
jgi:hypothetical protein